MDAIPINPVDPAPTARGGRVLIVTGAHLRAEVHDRPVAYRLADAFRGRIPRPEAAPPPEIIVCSDLWYLNNDDLRRNPTVSVGAPGVNALTASLAARLPSASVVENEYIVQLDPDFLDPIALVWGVSPRATSVAAGVFIERYLARFIESMGPGVED